MTNRTTQIPSFLWHDYETFGLDPRWDRVAQFAAIRTDLELQQIEEPIMWYCRPADDYLPEPQACLLTGITPQQALAKGLPEVEFMRRINAAMCQPETCVVGYNNLRFDDEFTRYGLYRNLLDPYAREWQQGNSRWDLIDLVRTASSIRPKGIVWPRNKNDELVLKLDQLAPANGIEHSDAHDALADVAATIDLARLIRKEQPRLFNFLLHLKDKRQVRAQLDLSLNKPSLHISGMYGQRQGFLTLVGALGIHPTNKNSLLLYDLQQDPQTYANHTVAELQSCLFNQQKTLPTGQQRLRVKQLHLNRCPVVTPMKVLTASDAKRYGINRQRCQQNLDWLRQQCEFRNRIIAAFSERRYQPASDVDADLYSGGFFSDSDRYAMMQVHRNGPKSWQQGKFNFSDHRLNEMLLRMKARNHLDQLSDTEKQTWETFRRQRLLEPEGESGTRPRSYSDFRTDLQQLGKQYVDRESQAVLAELTQYGEMIYPKY